MGGMFGNMFPQNNRAKTRVEKINVSLEDIYNEKSLKISYKKNVICDTCNGSGGMYSTSVVSCDTCDGKGKIMKVVQIGPGMISQSLTTCYKCNGKGKIIKPNEKCKKCKGNKYIKKELSVTLDLNKNIQTGSHMVIEDGGDEVVNGETGKLVFEINVKEHDIFKRIDNNLYMKKQILLSEALCGSKFTITHMDNRVLLIDIDNIHPNCNKKIIGEGIASNGDLVIEFEILYPTQLSDQRKMYLKKLLPIVEDIVIKDNYIETIVLDEAIDIPKPDNTHDIPDEGGVNCTQQ